VDSDLKRRDFLKILAMLPVLKLAWDIRQLGSPGLLQGATPDRPNVLILVFDALSATNMSLHGYPRQTTPNLERMVQKGTVFHRHYAGGNFTSPGTATILTGTLPWTHRAFHLYGTVAKQYEDNNIFKSFSDAAYQTLAFTHNDLAAMLLYQFREYIDLIKDAEELSLFYEYLLSNGVFENDHNAAFLSERVLVRGHRGLSRQLPSSLFLSMFHRLWRTREKNQLQREYRKEFPRGLPSTNATPFFYKLEDGIDWILDQISATSGHYLGYFHFLPPHEPYNPPKEFIGIFNDGWTPVPKPPSFFTEGYTDKQLNRNRRNYDEYVAYVDSQWGRLYDGMQQRGLLENTCLVITSDHGEMFERGILEHITPTLYEPITHIPLVIWRPGQQERVDVKDLTNSTDLVPSLLSLTGQPVPDWSEGELLPTFGNGSIDSQRSVFTVEAKSNPKNSPLQIGTVAMVKDRYKLIHYFGHDGFEDEYEMFDLINDPEELENLYSSQPEIAKDLQDELNSKMDEMNQPYERG
jgi:arylsulfatase A-like enzyme